MRKCVGGGGCGGVTSECGIEATRYMRQPSTNNTLSHVRMAAAEILRKFPEMEISGNFRKFPCPQIHFHGGKWKFLGLKSISMGGMETRGIITF